MGKGFDILDSVTGIVSIAALIVAVGTLYQTTESSRIEAINKQRSDNRVVLADAMQKLKLWQSEISSISDKAQPIFVQASEQWEKSGDVIESRDFLYKSLLTLFSSTHGKINEFKTASAYLELYVINEDLPIRYQKTYFLIDDLEKQYEGSTLRNAQQSMMSFATEKTRISAQMGNSLRSVLATEQNQFKIKTDYLIHDTELMIIDEFKLQSQKEEFTWQPSYFMGLFSIAHRS